MLLSLFVLVTLVCTGVRADDGIIETTQIILFNGDPGIWQTNMEGKTDAMASAIQTAIVQALYRPLITTTATVNSITTQAPDVSLTEMGNGSGGLLVKVSIKEVVPQGAIHPYDRDEINSILFTLKVPELDTVYDFGGAVTVQTVRTDLDYKLQCTSLCKGMIATGVILGFLMLVFFCILIVYSCCPSCFSKVPGLDKLDQP